MRTGFAWETFDKRQKNTGFIDTCVSSLSPVAQRTETENKGRRFDSRLGQYSSRKIDDSNILVQDSFISQSCPLFRQ